MTSCSIAIVDSKSEKKIEEKNTKWKATKEKISSKYRMSLCRVDKKFKMAKRKALKFICDRVFSFVNSAQFSFVVDFKIYFHWLCIDWLLWDFRVCNAREIRSSGCTEDAINYGSRTE